MPKNKDDREVFAHENDLLLRDLTTQYKAAAKKSSEAAIAKAETIVAADTRLKSDLLTKFYTDIGLAQNGPTARKFRVIAKAAPRLSLYLDKLPNAWTSLYEVAALKPDEFKRLMASGAVRPDASWAELKEALGRRAKSRKEDLRVYFDLNGVQPLRRAEFLKALKEVGSHFRVTYEAASKACQALIDGLVAYPAPNGAITDAELANVV